MFQTYGSTVIRSVDAGHEVERDGKKMTVSKGVAVYRGNEMFLEHSDYEELKKRPDVASKFIECPW